MHDGADSPEPLSKPIDRSLPVISVVIPFRRGEQCILDALHSIFGTDYPQDRLEVIVVDDGQDDALVHTLVRSFPAIRLLRNAVPLGCDRSKQAGIDIASGEILAMTDADCTVHPDWIRAIVKNLSYGADVATGPVRHPKTFLRELVAVSDFRDAQGDRYGWVNAFPGCNFALTRRLLEGIRYDRSGDITGGSDLLLSWKMRSSGRLIRFDPSMVVYHSPSVSIGSLIERRFHYGQTAIGMRKIDPTLPGAALVRLGILAPLAYISYKTIKDAYCLFDMTRRRLVKPTHAPLLLPSLLIFRLLDAAGMLSMKRISRKPV